MQFYTIAEVAVILETRIETIHEWIQEGLLPAVHFGSEEHMPQIRAQNLENFIDMRLRKRLIHADHL